MEQNKEVLEEEVETDEYVQYAIAFEKHLSMLESQPRNTNYLFVVFPNRPL